ncbi:hypothetical protein DFJ77DRAFT_508432 [Powellomyces hirtus]|nr:hypothetical protein DFJ77DRAFT_508432 [Powellomyces hirtus]
MLGNDKSQHGAPFWEKMDIILSDMYGSGRAVDGPMLEEWARHAGIKTLKDAEQFLRMIWWSGSPADVTDELYATLIKILRNHRDLWGAEALHRQAIKAGRAGDHAHLSMAITYCRLGHAEMAMHLCEKTFTGRIDDEFCALLIRKCGFEQISTLDEAVRIFGWAKQKQAANLLTYTSIVRILCAMGDTQAAEALCQEFTATNHIPRTTQMCNLLVWSYTKAGRVDEVRELIQRMQGEDIPIDAVTIEALMYDMGQKGDVDGAYVLFKRLPEISETAVPSVWTYNILLNFLLKSKQIDLAYEVMEQMKTQGVEPDLVTYGTLMNGFNVNKRPADALGVFNTLSRIGLAPDHTIGVLALTAYVALELVDDGVACLDRLRADLCDTSIHHWTILINGYLKQSNITAALNLLEAMLKNNYQPDVVSYTLFIEAYGQKGDLKGVQDMLLRIYNNGLQPDKIVYTTLIVAHAKIGQTERAIQAFDQMIADGLQPDVVTYTTVMHLLATQGNFMACDQMLDQMDNAQVWANVRTYTILIQESFKRGHVAIAVTYLERMVQTGQRRKDPRPKIIPDEVLVSALLRGFVSHNDLDSALRVFRIVSGLGVVLLPGHYVILIEGLSKGGLPVQCEAVYRRMLADANKEKDEQGVVIMSPWVLKKARDALVAALAEKQGIEGVRAFVRRERSGWRGIPDQLVVELDWQTSQSRQYSDTR